MNKFAKAELKKVKVAVLPPYDDSTRSMFIPKHYGVSGKDLKRDHCYILTIEESLLTSESGKTLNANWNNGNAPKYTCMKAEVSQLLGKMVKVGSIGYDLTTQSDLDFYWEGRLPINSVKIIKEI